MVKKLQGVSKKRYFSDFLSYFSSRGQILLFHMCFGIRISSPFHLAGIKIMSAHAFLGQLRF